MSGPHPSNDPIPLRFGSTRWSVVVAARDGDGEGDARAALESLCAIYWPPLYAYARRRGRSPEDAEDLTQSFFAALLEKGYLRAVRRERGPFRQFLLVVFRRFLASAHQRENRLKRGGHLHPMRFDSVLAERLYREEPDPAASADAVYDRQWALALVEQSLARLRGEWASFDILKPTLTSAKGAIDYAAMAADLGSTPGAARVTVHRFRRRFRNIVREEVAQTIDGESSLDDEFARLMAALERGIEIRL